MTSEKTKVLVVDDDSFIRDVLTAILEEKYSVDTAEDGAEALAKYTAAPDIGLIISDMNMPQMSGLELINKIRSMGSDVPIIILTGNNDVPVAKNDIAGGASDYVLKDENIQDAVALSVSRVLTQHELKRKTNS